MKSSKRRFLMGTKFVCSFLLLIAFVTSAWTVHVASSAAATKVTFTVMTRNLYLGSAFDPLLNAPTPDDIPERVAEVYAAILSSQYPCRAEAIADEIVQSQPDLVGLQEAVLLRVYSPCATSIPNPPQPTAFAIDYVQILLDALERRGAHYAVAAEIPNTDVTASSVSGDTIRATDRDVILVRTDLPTNELRVSNPQAENFKARFSVQIGGPGGPTVTVLRGWCSLDVKVGGKLVHVVSTHLEEEVPLIQSLQANELLTGPLHTSRPVIGLGDFNASVGSTTYGNLLGAGFQDAWTLAHPNPSDSGFSCCQAADLLNPLSQLSTRIDLILFRSKRISVNDIQLVGADPTDRLPSGLWPSDHAGVVGTLSIK
jgi:endonuclease/exonuclease/phosphatase family metal-dependent hydrolase